MSDDMTPKQMRDKIDQLKEEAKEAEAARQKLELENENLKLRVINVQQELTITQMNSEKEIAGLKAELKAKLESGPSNNGILVQKIDEMAKQMDGMAKQNGEMVKQIDGMAKQIDQNTNELQQLKKQSNQIRMISSSCSSSMHTTPAPTVERIEEVKSPMEVDPGSETGNNNEN